MDHASLKELRAEVAALDRYLLRPITATAPARLEDDERRAIGAFIVLAYAELEEFVEACFEDYARENLKVDSDGRVPVGMYQSLVKMAPQLRSQLTGDDFRPAKILHTLPYLIKQHVIDSNDGIRSNNCKTMAHAVGVDWVDLEAACPGLLPALDVLGPVRGGYAHTGALKQKGRASTKPSLHVERYPADVRQMVAEVTTRLGDLVDYLAHAPPRTPDVTWKSSVANALGSDLDDLRRWWSQRPFLRRRATYGLSKASEHTGRT